MRRFAKRWDAASPSQMLESLSAPERQQVQAEQAQGAVFFCYHPQLKLCGMNLLYARKALPAGQDGKGILCLERLQRFSVSGELAVLWGEFSVLGRPGHIVAGKLRVKGPLQNVRRLQAFLCWKQEQAGGQPPAGCREKLAGCLWRVRAFAASVQGSLGALLHMALAGCFFHETQGVLKGFVQIGGAHYPRYAYCAPDGRVFEQVGVGLSLEEAVPHAGVAGLLRRNCPRAVRVQYDRRNPAQSRCIYL